MENRPERTPEQQAALDRCVRFFRVLGGTRKLDEARRASALGFTSWADFDQHEFARRTLERIEKPA